jgi:hypothetical protein
MPSVGCCATVTDAADVECLVGAARGRTALQVYFERDGRIGISEFYVR